MEKNLRKNNKKPKYQEESDEDLEDVVDLERKRIMEDSYESKSDEDFNLDEEDDEVENNQEESENESESVEKKITTGKKRKAANNLEVKVEKKNKTSKEKTPKEKAPKEKTKKTKEEKKPKEPKTKEKKVKPPKIILDPNFNIETDYFYQELQEKHWTEIKNFLKEFLTSPSGLISSIENFFITHPNLKKGHKNLEKLQNM